MHFQIGDPFLSKFKFQLFARERERTRLILESIIDLVYLSISLSKYTLDFISIFLHLFMDHVRPL